MKRFVLGVTGGIASGKSTVVAELVKAGIPVCDSDDLAHACFQKKHPAYGKVVQHFGRTILTSTGDIDRRRLGEIVFKNEAERRWLQNQIHPYVLKGLKQFVRSHAGLIAVDIPLLYEAHYECLVDKIAVVYCKRAQQISRLKSRNDLTPAQARVRIDAQGPLSKKKKLADIVLDNTQTKTSLMKEVKKTLKALLDEVNQKKAPVRRSIRWKV